MKTFNQYIEDKLEDAAIKKEKKRTFSLDFESHFLLLSRVDAPVV